MEYRKDHIGYEDFYHFQVEPLKVTPNQQQLHYHDCLEINLVEAGGGCYRIEEQSYPIEEGDIFVINNEEKHVAVCDDCTLLVMTFDLDFVWAHSYEYDYLGPFFDRSPRFSNRIPRDVDAGYSRLRRRIACIAREYEERAPGWRMAVKGEVMLLLTQLYRYCQEKNALGDDGGSFRKARERMAPVLSYIQRHFQEEIRLEDLAMTAMMSKTYLCTYFKDVMKMTIFAYLERTRIDHSCLLLKTTALSVGEIAEQSGFNSLTYFNRVFRRCLGISPGAYRISNGFYQKC